MKKSSQNNIIYEYLRKRPTFYAFLRPQEALLFQNYFPLKKPVLDFGCGDGFFAKVAFKKQGKIEVGLDVDPDIKKEAEFSGSYEKVVIYDGRIIPFPDNYFSSIISNCVLEHVPDLEGCVKELNRVLKNGGKIYLTVVIDKWQDNLLGGKILGGFYRNWFKKIQRHENLFTKEKWATIFRSSGLEAVNSYSYFDKSQQSWCEIFHYLGIDSLLTRKLFGSWKIAGNLRATIFAPLVKKIVEKEDLKDCSCEFFILKKFYTGR